MTPKERKAYNAAKKKLRERNRRLAQKKPGHLKARKVAFSPTGPLTTTM